LPFVSDSTDPRVMHFKAGDTNGFGFVVYYPDKYYQPTAIQPLVFASGTEARLIRAESELAQGGTAWLTTLNALREPIGLPDLDDPGIDSARVSMLFKERAYWLFLTGHREGDLRRLVRQYQRLAVRVFPTGLYNGTARAYGSDVNAPVPAGERRNPLYTGCKNRDA